MPADESILNAQQAATLLGVHVETIRRLARRNEIPSFKVGTDWRFTSADLMLWAKGQKNPKNTSVVLIVDDDPTVVQSLARVVESLGCQAHSASSGVEALDFVARSKPDVIFLDLVMPTMNGPEFLERLRPLHPQLPVVIVTGLPDGELMQKASQHAPVLLLSKPAAPLQVERTLRALLGDHLSASLEHSE